MDQFVIQNRLKLVIWIISKAGCAKKHPPAARPCRSICPFGDLARLNLVEQLLSRRHNDMDSITNRQVEFISQSGQ